MIACIQNKNNFGLENRFFWILMLIGLRPGCKYTGSNILWQQLNACEMPETLCGRHSDNKENDTHEVDTHEIDTYEVINQEVDHIGFEKKFGAWSLILGKYST